MASRGRPGRKREREFLTQLKASFLARGAFFYKIPDMPHFEGAQFRFDLAKPFDAFGGFAGQAFVIEAKVMSGFKSFSLKDLRDSQVVGLDAWAKAGGKAFVFIMVWQKAEGSTKSIVNRLYILNWLDLKTQGKFTKAEILAMPHYPRLRAKGPSGSTVYRFNVDEFMISLVMD